MEHSPNILWIVTTQWRAQSTGFSGDANARTPSLDRLAAQSVNYTQAVTPHPFGPFARAALLTGRLSPENGVADYFDSLPAGTRTIAHDLAERGYRTAFFGKWHLGSRDRGVPLVGEEHARTIVPVEQRGGFAFWEGFESGFLLNDPWLHGSRLPTPQQFPGYQSDVLCDRAAEFLTMRHASPVGQLGELRDRGANEPWFAIVSLEAPHPPYNAPSGDVQPRDPREIQLRPNTPQGGVVEEKARRELAGYYAHIAATDSAIGRLIDQVAVENTIVVFTSVHGDMHGSHGHFRKGWPYEESVRVPLLVRRSTTQGNLMGECDAPISLADLRECTLAWAAGLPAAANRAYSLISMPSIVALPHQCDRVWHGLRTSSRKLVLNDDGSPWLFFDLLQDPYERENLIDDPTRVAEIRALRSQLQP
jgi:arylsulfatase A-like enzyme